MKLAHAGNSRQISELHSLGIILLKMRERSFDRRRSEPGDANRARIDPVEPECAKQSFGPIGPWQRHADRIGEQHTTNGNQTLSACRFGLRHWLGVMVDDVRACSAKRVARDSEPYGIHAEDS